MNLDLIDSPRNVSFVQRAGPREKLYFDPSKTSVGIITCGGLCPGLNSVIRAIVMCMWYRYNVRKITGFKYGYQGNDGSVYLYFIRL